ncbi:MAG: hypothetical protein LBH85_03535 [Treponema sp.]|jgi:hypothetical protein|nr:hypothetical protein [Treponema sp.]
MENETAHFTRLPLKMTIAARPRTGSAVAFNGVKQKWVVAPRSYFQIANGAYFEVISKEKALNEIDELLAEKFGNDKHGCY